MAFGISFGKQKQKSSGSTQDFGSDVWGGQSPFLQELYRMGSSMAGGSGMGYGGAPMQQQPMYQQQAMPAPVPQAIRQPTRRFGGGRQGLENRQNAASRARIEGRKAQPAAMPQQMQPQYAPQQRQSFAPGTSPADPWMRQASGMLGEASGALSAFQRAQDPTNFGAVDQRLNSFSDPTVDPAFNAYSQTLGQQFREQFMPELQGQSALAGGLGGSRQQIGSALGAQRAMQELGNFGANAYAGQQERALAAQQARGQLAGMQSQSWGGQQERALAAAQAQGNLADFARSILG